MGKGARGHWEGFASVRFALFLLQGGVRLVWVNVLGNGRDVLLGGFTPGEVGLVDLSLIDETVIYIAEVLPDPFEGLCVLLLKVLSLVGVKTL